MILVSSEVNFFYFYLHQKVYDITFFFEAKKHAGPKISHATTSTSKPTDGSRPHFPLTERQQLQYLLEVTAKEAKQDSGSSSNDDFPAIANRATKKDASTDNQIEARIRKRNERGETALHLAAIRGDLEDLVFLIKAGALVNSKDNAGELLLRSAMAVFSVYEIISQTWEAVFQWDIQTLRRELKI